MTFVIGLFNYTDRSIGVACDKEKFHFFYFHIVFLLEFITSSQIVAYSSFIQSFQLDAVNPAFTATGNFIAQK